MKHPPSALLSPGVLLLGKCNLLSKVLAWCAAQALPSLAGVELDPEPFQELCPSFISGNLPDPGNRDPTWGFGLLCLCGRILGK